MLSRYAAKGEFAGDTWHPTEEEALEQAAFEYDLAVVDWIDVPASEDAIGFGTRGVEGRG